jgi:2-polyprenyl-3-methyl-5-hydroxy-6-metoxy-1,4-benzoquinol methylase
MKLNRDQYQYGFSDIHADAMYNREGRTRKARTMAAVLGDYFGADLKSLSLLDIGCSTGVIANVLSDHFGQVIGIDIDQPAVAYASEKFRKDNLSFLTSDSLNISQPDNRFDAVICAQVYEHVPDSARLTNEIYRVLKPGGVCYFAAGNRLQLIEPHYNLPFLSAIPRKMAHGYVRLAKKGNSYYEKHLSYWGLKRLVRKFDCIDYTQKIIEDPQRYHVEYMIPPGSMKQRAALTIIKLTPWLSPGYVWLLKKIVPNNAP